MTHHVLPPAAVLALQRAAQTPVTPADPLARIKAVEAATEWIKRKYPDLYKAGAP